jgi:phosphohistidine phosphatase
MELYILRHGEAQPREPGVADADRALVKKGRDDVRDVVKAARSAKVDPQLILTSPLRRAKETADIAVAGFKKCPLKETDAMLPDASPDAIWKEASALKMGRVMVVGHEPHLGQLISFLLGNEITVDFKKGGLIRIDVEGRGKPRGRLKWYLTPRLARG